MTVEDIVNLMVWHDANHLDQLHRALRGDAVPRSLEEADGIIVLFLRASDAGGGPGRLEYPPSHPNYQKVLRRLGGMNPGEIENVARGLTRRDTVFLAESTTTHAKNPRPGLGGHRATSATASATSASRGKVEAIQAALSARIRRDDLPVRLIPPPSRSACPTAS